MKNEIIESVNSIHEQMKIITKAGSCGEYAGEAEYEDTTNIINVVLESPIVKNLLTLFWQRCSDACPLEAKEQEQQEIWFKAWIDSNDLDSLIQASIFLFAIAMLLFFLT